jgi:hypothetical protein
MFTTSGLASASHQDEPVSAEHPTRQTSKALPRTRCTITAEVMNIRGDNLQSHRASKAVSPAGWQRDRAGQGLAWSEPSRGFP